MRRLLSALTLGVLIVFTQSASSQGPGGPPNDLKITKVTLGAGRLITVTGTVTPKAGWTCASLSMTYFVFNPPAPLPTIVGPTQLQNPPSPWTLSMGSVRGNTEVRVTALFEQIGVPANQQSLIVSYPPFWVP
jgi:hypothetical protein